MNTKQDCVYDRPSIEPQNDELAHSFISLAKAGLASTDSNFDIRDMPRAMAGLFEEIKVAWPAIRKREP
jgi:hypothetical protein